MVEIEIAPIDKIRIYEVIPFDYEDFINLNLSGIPGQFQVSLLKWCEGVLFKTTSLPYTPEIVRDRINGIVHWESIQACRMEKYQATIKIANGMIKVIDITPNKKVVSAIQQLKTLRVI